MKPAEHQHGGTHAKAAVPALSPQGKARRILAGLSLALAVAAIGFATTDKFFEQTSFDPTNYSDAKKAGIDIRVDESKSYFEMTLLTLGALWALVVAQKEETRIKIPADRPEILMFAAALVVLLLSIIWHNIYLDAVSEAYSKSVDLASLPNSPPGIKGTKMPDVFQPAIDSLLQYQVRFFVCGILLAGFTLFSAHQLKEKSK